MASCYSTGSRHAAHAPGRAEPLDERDARILIALAHEGEATVAFQGLRHRLGLHQQILTRALRRLEGDGFVAREAGGYRLTEDGFGAIVTRAPRDREACGLTACAPREVLSLAHVLLPPAADADAVADHLKGRWFKGLRWYGEARHPHETTLTWIVADGDALVRARLAGGAVTVEGEVHADEPDATFRAAPPLLSALADALAGDRPAAS